jgi:hypothetical protein
MKKKLIVSFSLLLGTFFLQAQTKTIPYQELKSASGASTGSGMFFGASMTVDSITITFAGPSTRWIGLGFGTSMSGSDALIYTSSGSTQDWCDYFMGSYSSVVKDAKQDWNIKSNNVSGSTRTLVASRKLNTGDLKEDVVFNYNAVSINLIWARGSGSSFNLADHGGSNRAYGIALGWVSPDVTPPTISSLSPIDNAIGVSTSQSLKATFNENITLGTGTISLFTANDVIAETFTLPISNVSVNGATVSIKPTNLLKDSTAYYVIISNTAIKDVAGNFFTGITASSDWNFKTLTPQISADIVEISDKQYIKFTNSSIFIATNESDYDFQITDLQGNIIKEKNKVQGELTINISEFEPALYILTYRTNGNFLQRKFVVQ